jgi:protein-S-isoprenylcysteine O-methyltransferase Ste14
MSRVRIGLSLAALIVAIALILFLPAGRVDWFGAWVWLGITFVGLTVTRHFVVRAHPDLPARRRTAGEGTPRWDHHILAVFRGAIIATLVVAALDAGRFGWSSFPLAVTVTGMVFLAAGLGLFGLSVVHNPFFESTVRIQSDLQHTVTRSGPYRVVRHPGYAGLVLVVLGTPMVLGSAWALIPAAAAAASLILRTTKEDRHLRDGLPGYAEYCSSTRFRLIPWMW